MTSIVDRLAALFREPREAATTPGDGDGPSTDGGRSGDDGDDERSVGEVAAVVGPSAEGVRRYTAALSVAGGEIAAVEPGALERHFEVREGGAGTGFVRVRAVDFSGEARRVEGAIVLFSVALAAPTPASDVSLSVESIVDHADEAVPADRVRLNVVA